MLCADIAGKEEPDMEKLEAYVAGKVEPCLVPKKINFTAEV